MGEVYSGRDIRLDRIVALKVLRPEIARDPVWRTRLEGEARAISRLHHPHICTLYDITKLPLAWVDRNGKFLGDAVPKGPYNAIAISPDQQQVALTRRGIRRSPEPNGDLDHQLAAPADRLPQILI
jgi:serine/threonine protein kinase